MDFFISSISFYNQAKKILADIASKKFVLIGEDASSITTAIDLFIKENKFNIYEDLDKIAKELADKVPVRPRSEGYCIKSSFGRKCPVNEFACAMDECPNFCTSYHFSKISYEKYRNWLEAMTINQKSGFLHEADRQRVRLIKLIEKRLIPELLELRNEINNNGIDFVLLEVQGIDDIAINIEKIIMEVEACLQKLTYQKS